MSSHFPAPELSRWRRTQAIARPAEGAAPALAALQEGPWDLGVWATCAP